MPPLPDRIDDSLRRLRPGGKGAGGRNRLLCTSPAEGHHHGPWPATPAGVGPRSREQGAVVIVEVKARCSVEYGSALEAIGPRKTRRLRAAALWWLAERGFLPCEVRFDAVAVLLDAEGLPCRLEHVRDILNEGR